MCRLGVCVGFVAALICHVLNITILSQSWDIILAIVPAITYLNADTQKLDIFKDNKDKSGVYR